MALLDLTYEADTPYQAWLGLYALVVQQSTNVRLNNHLLVRYPGQVGFPGTTDYQLTCHVNGTDHTFSLLKQKQNNRVVAHLALCSNN